MPSVYKNKGKHVWKIEFRDQEGHKKVISSGTTDKRVAEALGHKIEEDALRIRKGSPPLHPEATGVYLGLVEFTKPTTTWKEFRQRFEAEYLSGLRERTREKHGTVLDVFEQEMKPHQLRDLDERTISGFVAALRNRPIVKRGKPTGKIGLAPWTIKNYLIALKTMLGWAVEQKFIGRLPAFPTVKVPKLKPQPIDEGDWLKLLAAAPSVLWRTYLLCGWLGGLRLSEAYRLRRTKSDEWPWLDLAADRIVLPARFVKADEDQWIPLHPQLREALEQLPNTGDEVFPFRSRRTGEPLTRNGVTGNVIEFAKRAGVKLSMHKLRKGFGCRVAKQLGKGNAPILHRLMRHSSMQITMDFYASVDDVLHDAIRELDRGSDCRPTPKPTPGSPEPQEPPQ